ARRGSARTLGDISMQLLADYSSDSDQIDRLLCGPTSEKWIEPWRRHLTARGVRFHLGSPARAIHTLRGVVTAVDRSGRRVGRSAGAGVGPARTGTATARCAA